MTFRTALPPVRRPAAILLQAATLVSLIGSTAAWTMTDKTVSVSVDGVVRQVDTRGDTVADVLAAAKLDVGENDLLAPSADSKISDGTKIAVRRGRQLTLVVDGVERVVWVTTASVDEALVQVGLRDSGMLLSASRSRSIGLDGLRLDVTLPKAVTVVADGRARALRTTARDVGAVLAEAKVAVGAKDLVSVPLTRLAADGLVVRITRVTQKGVVESIPVPFATERRADASMFKGQTRVVREGKVGVIQRYYVLRYVDGKAAGRTLTRTVKTVTQLSRVVAFGTKARPAPQRSVSGADGLNWGALARCESGGNPRAVSSGGTYRGLYQFSMSTWRGVGGSGDPIDASSGEQTYRAKLLYKRAGRSPWPSCGRYL